MVRIVIEWDGDDNPPEVIETDAIVIWEKLTDPDSPDGETLVNIFGTGVFENVTIEGVRLAMASKFGPHDAPSPSA